MTRRYKPQIAKLLAKRAAKAAKLAKKATTELGPENGLRRGASVEYGKVHVLIDAVLAGMVYFHFFDTTVGWIYDSMPETAWIDDRQRNQRLDDLAISHALTAVLRRIA